MKKDRRITIKYKYFICDMDGTLIRLPINWEDLRNKLKKLLKTDHHLKPIASTIPQAARGNKELIKKAYELVLKVELMAVKSIKYDKELVDFFRKLKETGYKIALVTLQGREPALKALERLGVLKFFDVTITREDSSNREEQLRIALKLLNANPSVTIFVGDSEWDVEAGLKTGCLTVYVSNSWSKPKKKPHIMVSKITELSDILF